MDPEELNINDPSQPGYDIYLDTEGYAVPNKLVQRNSTEEVGDTIFSILLMDFAI